jgi:hypothetical protein
MRMWALVLVALSALVGCVGPVGPSGEDGEDGDRGTMGVPGEDGTNGRDGVQGKMGLPGMDGQDGATGPMGLPGQEGDDGSSGLQGPMGLPGRDGGGEDTLAFAESLYGFEDSIFNVYCPILIDGQPGTARGTGWKHNAQVFTARHVVTGATGLCQVYDQDNFAIGTVQSITSYTLGGVAQDVVGLTMLWTATGEQRANIPVAATWVPKSGEPVGLLSFPWDFTSTVQYTFGHLSGNVAGELADIQWGLAILTDLVAYHGSSGAPVFNRAGQVVAILVGGSDSINQDLTTSILVLGL